MSKTGYEIMSVEKITDSKNQTYICRIRAPIPTQIRNDQTFLALFGNAQMKQGKINFFPYFLSLSLTVIIFVTVRIFVTYFTKTASLDFEEK